MPETIAGAISRPELKRGTVRYRNHFRWRVMPPDGAYEHGFFDRSFSNKKEAVAYQKRVKETFPNQPCSLLDTGRWFDSYGNIIR
jgi:hypothetical protein